MKKILFALLTCWIATQAYAGDSQWITSVPKAQTKAKAEHKIILLDFTGSDWCVWCKKLDADTFSKPDFLDYAKKNLVLVEVDFPSQKAQSAEQKSANEALQKKYEVDGYPTLVALDADGKIVWKHVGYLDGGPSALIAKLDEVKKKSS
jgi:protein disulfide-isomerase